MRKLSTKFLTAHPELALLLDEVKTKKAAVNHAKLQKVTLEEELKSAKKALKKQLKALPKAGKKVKATTDSNDAEAIATEALPKNASKKAKPASGKKSTSKKTS